MIDLKKIDIGIRGYITKINDFRFLKTKFSCQGHYYSKKNGCVIYYDRIIKGEIANGRWIDSRIQFPYVLIWFMEKELRTEFIRILRKYRWYLKDEYGCSLALINDRNKKYINHDRKLYIFKDCLYAVNLDDNYLHLTIVIDSGMRSRYEKNRIRQNILIRKIRILLFNVIISVLEELNKHVHIGNESE